MNAALPHPGDPEALPAVGIRSGVAAGQRRQGSLYRARHHHSRAGWEPGYQRTLVVADFAVGLAAGGLAFAARFGAAVAGHNQGYLIASAVFPAVFVALLAVNRAYERRHLYVGTEEYQRVIRAGLWLVAGAAITSYALDIPLARGWLLVAFPVALLGCLITRYAIRKQLHLARARGERLRRVIVVGHELAAIDLARRLGRERFHGMEVVGACLPSTREAVSGSSLDLWPELDAVTGDTGVADDSSGDGSGAPGRPRPGGGLSVYGSFEDVGAAVEAAGADAVIALGCPELDGVTLRRLAWRLERDDIDLILASSLIDVAGDRTTIRPVDGLPMLHVEHPRLTGPARVVKELVDRMGAAFLLVLAAPVLVAVTLCIRLTSPGPVLFRQVRTGRDGRQFVIYKFRTMYLDAEARLAEVRHLNEHDGVLFKIRNDPRVTPAGRWLRRLSLDELPQLLNVLRGQMSLVGPRPPLPEEVAEYPADVRRRLAVKPGMTGLWQVSGRSDLPWHEAVRLDLRYVENWSLFLDMAILLRTLTAVCRTSGAY